MQRRALARVLVAKIALRAAALVGLLLIALPGCSDRASDSPEIAPSGELQERYGLSAEDRPTLTIDPAEVPPDLRDLIPYAEYWGVGDDVIRSEIAERTSEAEKRAFREALAGRATDVNAWLDGFPIDEPMSDAAAAYMYMLSALDEIGP